MAKSTVSEWRGRFERRLDGRHPGAGSDAVSDLRFVAGSWVKDTSVSKDEAFMFWTGHWRCSVLERLTYWQPGAKAGVRAMPEIMLAEADRLMMRKLWMPLWSLRRAWRGVILAQPANGSAGEDDDSDLDEVEVGGAIEMNGHDGNDVGDMEILWW